MVSTSAGAAAVARSIGVTPADMLLKIVKVPGLALLATIGFLSFNYCSSVEGFEHHRWRHRDRNQHFDISQDMRDSRSLGFGLCSRCPPGFGVARRCTLVQDTVCHSCPQGYYAPSYSRKHACWPCSRCGQGLYEVHPCTGTSDTVCDACLNQPHFGNHPELANEPDPTQQIADYQRQCGHHNLAASSQQRNLLSTIADNNSKKRTTSSTGDLIHFLGPTNDHDPGRYHLDGTDLAQQASPVDNLMPTGSFPSETNDEEVALGVAQLAAFQVVLIFTAVAAILALTCRLRVFSSHEPARLKLTENYRDDGVALIEQLSES